MHVDRNNGGRPRISYEHEPIVPEIDESQFEELMRSVKIKHELGRRNLVRSYLLACSVRDEIERRIVVHGQLGSEELRLLNGTLGKIIQLSSKLGLDEREEDRISFIE